jgi:hypothetical protein
MKNNIVYSQKYSILGVLKNAANVTNLHYLCNIGFINVNQMYKWNDREWCSGISVEKQSQ